MNLKKLYLFYLFVSRSKQHLLNKPKNLDFHTELTSEDGRRYQFAMKGTHFQGQKNIFYKNLKMLVFT